MTSAQNVHLPAPEDPAADPQPAPTEPGSIVFLSVQLNGNPDNDLIQFTERDGQLYLSPESAGQIRFSADFLAGISADTPLSQYPGVQYDYQRDLQSIRIRAPFSILDLDSTIVGIKPVGVAIARASPGLLVNYDLYSSYTNTDDVSLSGFSEFRAFNNLGVFSTSHLFQGARNSAQHQWERSTVRLDTVLEHSLQEQQITFRLGDTITNGTSWSRQTRIGGFQVARNFTLQPYQTTAPMPAYFGTAALPSAVELYVNGIQQYTGKVPAGPFELNTMPSVNGAGQAQVVMIDALGRRSSISFPFYKSSRLLRAGLSDWSFETGYVRNQYGYESFDYDGKPMASGTLRYGLNNAITLESHLEGSQDVASGGLGAIVNIGMAGTVSGSWSQGRSQGRQGKQYTAGYEWQYGALGLGMNLQRSDLDFRDVASGHGGLPVLRSDSAYVGVDAGMFGSLALNYAYLQQADQPRYRYGGASWSRNFDHGVTLSLSANQNLDERSERTVFLNLTFNLEKGLSAYSTTTQANGDRTVSAGLQQSARQDGDWNWGVQAQHSDTQISGSATAGRRTRYLDFNVGINSAGDSQNVYAGATGALVAMDGGLFASRRIQDGFALVSTSGIPDIPVKNQNQLVGSTDQGGQLLVPALQAYQHNKIAIDPTGLPVDMRIERVELDAVPRHASGLNVRFQIERVQAASLLLKTPDGLPVPMGAQARLNDRPDLAGWVGYDGRLYVEGLKTDNRLHVQTEGLDCTVRFAYQAQADTLPEIGPLLCD